jgi:Uridine kinase
MNKSKPYIISISAVSGGGKTTITKRLNELLPNSKALFFDDYEFQESPDDICDWVERGSDYAEWNLDLLVNDINKLIVNREERLEYILLDYPFSRLHSGLSKYIDKSVFIDTPLDVAMARRILRDFKNGTTEDVLSEMSNYLSRGRQAYLGMLASEKNNCELIIDGTKPIESIVKELYETFSSDSQHIR